MMHASLKALHIGVEIQDPLKGMAKKTTQRRLMTSS